MLTFLRKIRKSIIGGSSVRTYPVYAIGEIALVVIGILIALQISNWDQQNQYRELERRHLESAIQQLTLDAETLQDEFNYNDLLSTQFTNAKRIIQDRRYDLQDSLGKMAKRLIVS